MRQPSAIPTSHWRYFPWAIAGGMGVVIAVNITMAVLATRSFPGNVGSDGFTLSNRYNQVMQSARQDQGRGWVVVAALSDARPRISARNRGGAPLVGAQVHVIARRPIGDDTAIALTALEAAPGVHVVTSDLPALGQWDLTIAVTAEGETMTTTQRVIRK